MNRILLGVFFITLAVFFSNELFANQPFKKVFIIVLENADYDRALKQPFLHQLSKQGALLTNYFAITHPSQPNYIALISGSTFGINSDKDVNLTGNHIGDLLEAKGLNWKVYAEGYPQ